MNTDKLIKVPKQQRISEDFCCESAQEFVKSQVPGSKMKFIAVEEQVSIVFRHVMFCVTQAETALRI